MFFALIISTPLKKPQDIALMEEPFDMTGEEIGVQGFGIQGFGTWEWGLLPVGHVKVL